LSDGRLLSGSEDRTIRLWDVVNGIEIARLELDSPIFSMVAIAPDRIVAGDEHGILHWLDVVG
jgi:hypothetical protein